MIQIKSSTYIKKNFSTFLSTIQQGMNGIITQYDIPIVVFVNLEVYRELPAVVRSQEGTEPGCYIGGFVKAYSLWQYKIEALKLETQIKREVSTHEIDVQYVLPEDLVGKDTETTFLEANSRTTQTMWQQVMEKAIQGHDTVVTKYDIPCAIIITPMKFGTIPGVIDKLEKVAPYLQQYFIKNVKKEQPDRIDENRVKIKDGKYVNDFEMAFKVWRGDKRDE